MNTLLVSVDFSPGTEKLLATAADLARGLGCRLRLFHVVEPVAAYVPIGASMDVITPPPAGLEQAELPDFEHRLESLAADLRARGLDTEVRVTTGLPAEEILEEAKNTHSKMIAVGSHGHGALYHLFAGSVVNAVLRHSPIPVVVVPVSKKTGA